MVDSFRENSAVNEIDFKQSVRAATTENITLSGTQTVDGVFLVAGDRVLVKNQSSSSENGIYSVSADSWYRSLDADKEPKISAGMMLLVEQGTLNAGTLWILSTSNPITVGTTGLSFTQFSGGGGAQGTQGTTGLSSIYSTNIGDGSSTSFTVTHNLNVSADVFVMVRDTSLNYYVYPDIKYSTANAIIVEFVSAPSSNQYKVTVYGA